MFHGGQSRKPHPDKSQNIYPLFNCADGHSYCEGRAKEHIVSSISNSVDVPLQSRPFVGDGFADCVRRATVEGGNALCAFYADLRVANGLVNIAWIRVGIEANHISITFVFASQTSLILLLFTFDIKQRQLLIESNNSKFLI